MTTRKSPAPDSPDTVRGQYIAALQAAAHRCGDDCGLDEQACDDTHPITWSGTSGQETYVEGPVSAIVDVLLTARDGAAAGRHVYLSTGCLHGDHGYCQSNTGSNGTKIPAVCKFCGTPCTCKCHREAGRA